MKNQFEKIRLKKTHAKNTSVEIKRFIQRDFAPFKRKNTTSATRTADAARTTSTRKVYFI